MVWKVRRFSFSLFFLCCCVCLQDSLPVVLHRFSDGVEVVKCVMEFCNVCYCSLRSSGVCLFVLVCLSVSLSLTHTHSLSLSLSHTLSVYCVCLSMIVCMFADHSMYNLQIQGWFLVGLLIVSLCVFADHNNVQFTTCIWHHSLSRFICWQAMSGLKLLVWAICNTSRLYNLNFQNNYR